MRRRCASCGLAAQCCVVCAGDADLHEHVYGEWYCRKCWASFLEPAESQDADCFQVEAS